MTRICFCLVLSSLVFGAEVPEIAIEHHGRAPLWLAECRYRLSLDVGPLPQRREGQIAWADLPLAFALRQLGHSERSLDWDSMRLYRVGDPDCVPFSIERIGGFHHVGWRRTDDAGATHRYHFYFDVKPALAGATSRPLKTTGAASQSRPASGPADFSQRSHPTPRPAFIGVGDRLEFGRPDVKDFVGWGLWATPFVLDWDDDKDWDLIVYGGGPASAGAHLFLNDGTNLFGRGEYLGDSGRVLGGDFDGDGRVDAMKQGGYFADVVANGFDMWVKLDVEQDYYCGRFTYWLPVDWNGDGLCDVLVATCDWRQYGWDGGYDHQGNWLAGLLHASLYVHINQGTPGVPRLAKAFRVTTEAGPLDSFGLPIPCAADWDGDGDLDLIVGSFVDWLAYYENTGTRCEPKFAAGREVKREDGKELRLHHCMMQPLPVDWDRDGDIDLIIGEEDGMVSLVANVAGPKSEPRFHRQVYLRAVDVPVRTGALCVPNLVDWDGDGDDDLITGCVQGMFELFTNVGSNAAPAFRRSEYLDAGDRNWRILAGVNGSIQGPAEAKWGYTAPHVADWDADGLLDVVTNSIWGEILWARNVGTATAPKLAAPQRVDVRWNGPVPKPAWVWWKPKGNQLVTQWRTRPFVIDLNRDSLPDLVVMDHEGYLAFFERYREGSDLHLRPPQRIFLDDRRRPFRLTSKERGGSGRVKIELCDWDGDGDLDLLRSTRSIGWYENVGSDAKPVFKDRGDLCDRVFCGHTDSPCTFDWNGDGKLDLLVGVEGGHFYVFDRSYIDHKRLLEARIMSK